MGKSSKKPKFDTTPTSIPTTKKVKEVKKGRRGSDEVLDKLAGSKKEKVEVQQVSLTMEKVKRMKTDLIEPPGEKKEETGSLDFEGEIAAAPTLVSQTKEAKKGKRGNDDMTEKQECSKKKKIELEKVVLSNKKVKKLKMGLIDPRGKKKDESSDFEAKDTDNERKDSLTDDAENKKTCTIFENVSKTLAERDDKSGAKRLFVGNLSPEVIKDDLLEFFKEAGKVIEVQLAAKGDGSFRGFGHVEFATAEEAQRALGMNYQLLLGRRVMIDFAVEKGSNNAPKGKVLQDSAHCIYVKGFGKSLGEDQIRNSLKEHFGSCGEIIRISIPQDNKTGRSKGFAYILFNNQATVSKALELNGTGLGSYTLTVEQPAPKGGARDGAYRGCRGSRGRSADRGEDGGGHGKGRREAGAPYNSATTASKDKRTFFGDNY